jgi:hypothetical protein
MIFGKLSSINIGLEKISEETAKELFDGGKTAKNDLVMAIRGSNPFQTIEAGYCSMYREKDMTFEETAKGFSVYFDCAIDFYHIKKIDMAYKHGLNINLFSDNPAIKKGVEAYLLGVFSLEASKALNGLENSPNYSEAIEFYERNLESSFKIAKRRAEKESVKFVSPMKRHIAFFHEFDFEIYEFRRAIRNCASPVYQ